jgi:outer membrane protein assembly factor BamE
MPAFDSSALRAGLAVLACAAVSACGTLDSVSHRVAGSLAPYQVEVVQGNFVSREQVEALRPGMSRQRVRDILGTPLVTSVFHANRWDYVFTLKRQGAPVQERKLTVYFDGDTLARVEGDPMPTEAEFVASLDSKRRKARIPELEASEESLKQFSAGPGAPSPAGAPIPAPALPSYPPLEPPAR